MDIAENGLSVILRNIFCLVPIQLVLHGLVGVGLGAGWGASLGGLAVQEGEAMVVLLEVEKPVRSEPTTGGYRRLTLLTGWLRGELLQILENVTFYDIL